MTVFRAGGYKYFCIFNWLVCHWISNDSMETCISMPLFWVWNQKFSFHFKIISKFQTIPRNQKVIVCSGHILPLFVDYEPFFHNPFLKWPLFFGCPILSMIDLSKKSRTPYPLFLFRCNHSLAMFLEVNTKLLHLSYLNDLRQVLLYFTTHKLWVINAFQMYLYRIVHLGPYHMFLFASADGLQ